MEDGATGRRRETHEAVDGRRRDETHTYTTAPGRRSRPGPFDARATDWLPGRGRRRRGGRPAEQKVANRADDAETQRDERLGGREDRVQPCHGVDRERAETGERERDR